MTYVAILHSFDAKSFAFQQCKYKNRLREVPAKEIHVFSSVRYTMLIVGVFLVEQNTQQFGWQR